MKAFLDELKRRNVIRVGGIYILAGWILMQAAALLEDALSLPAWFDTIIVSLILLGFPVVLLFAWVFEVTPEGLRRTPAVDTPEGQAFAASTRRRLDRALIAGIVLAVGVVAADRLLPRATAPASAAATEGAATTAPESRRVAFFGFTAADTGTLSEQIAGVATDETYATLTTIGIETASRGDTEGVAPKDQLARATALDARYALGGSVRISGEQVTVTIRLDDARTRATLWQRTLTGGSAQSESLPVQAAAKATNLLQCLINVRIGMAREDAGALALITRACDTKSFDPESLTRWREVVDVAPASVVAQSILGMTWILQSAVATSADRQAMLREARQAFERGLAIEPDRADVRSGMDLVDIATDRPLSEIVSDLNSMLGVGVDRSKRRSIANVALARLGLLSAVGQSAEAARLGRSEVAADPLNAPLQSIHAGALYASGQIPEARRVYKSVNRRHADIGNWYTLTFLAIFEGDDLAPVVAVAPPGISPEQIACWQAVASAARASDPKVRRAGAQCMQGPMGAGFGGTSVIAALGDVDSAFANLDQFLDRSNPFTFVVSGSMLFSPHVTALRADPRFLPLMKKVGIYQYWLDTGSHPDVCDTQEERGIELCVALRADQANR